MSENEEPVDPFDAFRARRTEEQAANEEFPEQYEPTQYEPTQYVQPLSEQPFHAATSGSGRGRLRSVAVLAGAAVLVAGVVGGVYAATRSSGSPAAASGPSVSASPTSSPSAGAKKGEKNAKAVIARLKVTSVGTDSFTATAANGQTVTAHITSATRFGTAARPFTRAQLVTGADVYARLRREADGTVVATVIASSTTDKGSASASANPSASTSDDAGT